MTAINATYTLFRLKQQYFLMIIKGFISSTSPPLVFKILDRSPTQQCQSKKNSRLIRLLCQIRIIPKCASTSMLRNRININHNTQMHFMH